MTPGGDGYPTRFPGDPIDDLLPCRDHRRWQPINLRVRRYTQKRGDAFPRKSHRCQAAKLVVEPITDLLMVRRTRVESIDQQIRVEQDQLKSSPSAIANISLTETMSAMRQRPSETGCVRDPDTWDLVGAFISFNPRRSASFTSCFKLLSSARRRRSRIAAMSSSRVKVVNTTT
jgi:hypothetical protein